MKLPVIFEDIELSIPDDTEIYNPAEDTYLLLNMVKDFFLTDPILIRKISQKTILEMGTGSGIGCLYLCRYCKEMHSIDINFNASRFLQQQSSKMALTHKISSINGDLLSWHRIGNQHKYFIAFFNPPYLPLESGEKSEFNSTREMKDGDRALYSEEGGFKVLKSFLTQLVSHLEPEGHVFFVYSSLTNIGEISEWLSNLGYLFVEKRELHIFFETIYAIHAKLK